MPASDELFSMRTGALERSPISFSRAKRIFSDSSSGAAADGATTVADGAASAADGGATAAPPPRGDVDSGLGDFRRDPEDPTDPEDDDCGGGGTASDGIDALTACGKPSCGAAADDDGGGGGSGGCANAASRGTVTSGEKISRSNCSPHRG